MLNLLANIVLISALACGKEALPVTPLDIQVGRHAVELRISLEVRAPGARLILFVRETDGLGITDPDVADAFKTIVPEGSVSAFLTGRDGKQLKLVHTGYSFYRGYKGLVLTEADPIEQAGPQMFSRLELDSKLALNGVRAVWIDRAVLQVWDVYPRL
ncbi:MAG: hypothetical protein O7B81_11440 [Gammaproteobacteria bacterium]|nr:hypothetical protein [Gammaproteobacteria bacterium]